MEVRIKNETLQIEGMTCSSCETKIENKLRKLEGMLEVKVFYSNSSVLISYDENKVNIEQITKTIENLDYSIKKEVPGDATVLKETNKMDSVSQIIGFGLIVFALYLIIKNTVGFNFIPEVNSSMGYGILFVVGLLTSLHCIAMCGGINLSQCVSYKTNSDHNTAVSKLKPSLLYNLGRVISYTIIGGFVGLLGSVVSFSGTAKGIVAVVAGLFMVIMGLNMLNIFPWLRKINPRMPKIFRNKISKGKTNKGPLFVGLLNGLMPCGPLQAMQLFALGTGSFTRGALSMFFFSIGTVPLMFGLGAISTFMGAKFTQKMMKASAVLVMFLGFIMLSRGLAVSGVSLPSFAGNLPKIATQNETFDNIAKIQGNVQLVTTKIVDGQYEPITVQKGIPVKWTIKAEEGDLNGCNKTMLIQKFNIEKKLVPGENIIEFTPTEEGDIGYSCWMGMITSNIKVVTDVTKVETTSGAKIDNSQGVEAVSSSTIGVSGCCAAGSQATNFLNGKIPTDDIRLAKVKDGIQEVTITVNDQGYAPAVVVLQKDIKAKIKFNTEKINSCNNIVVFPDYDEQLNLGKGQIETPVFTPDKDFSFQCGMGMLNGMVKVVEDINKVNMDDIKKEVGNVKPVQSSGGGGCCGG